MKASHCRCNASVVGRRLTAFRFSLTQEYAIEWGEERLRFYSNGVRIETAPGVPYEVAVPYTAAEAPLGSIEQSYDRLYIDHPNHPPARLTRTGASTFVYDVAPLANGPFGDRNTDQTITVSSSATTGNGITLTASSAIFDPGQVGALFRIEALDFAAVPAWQVTATPGNLLIGLLSRTELLHLSANAFLDVLIVSAIDPTDPIADTLLNMLDHWAPIYRDTIRLRIVRVANRCEFVAALNTYGGAIMIFDGHGTHDRITGVGTIRIGNENVSIWDLRNDIRVPPVVFLSACDTHAADRSHATTANAFLNAGALTVVASLLPIDAEDAAMLAARLVWRLASFLSAVTGPERRAVLWSEVMAGMLRLQLVYDLLMPLVQDGRLSRDCYAKINVRAIEATTNQEPGWWDEALDAVAEILGLYAIARDELSRRVVATSDTIRYTQVGNPERIVIKSTDLLRAVGYDLDD